MNDHDGQFRIHDTILSVSWKKPTRGFDLGRDQWEPFNRLCDALTAAGFVVGSDPRIDAHHACLSKYHRYGRRGDLEVCAEVYATGCKFEFFQNVVIENRNGGRYDFDKLQKMPYLIRKAWELSRRRLSAVLMSWGYEERKSVESPNPDPLADFNDRWDGEYEKKRGVHRFKRREDGWPDDSEIYASKQGVDANGARIEIGSIRYTRDRKGYLRRGRMYPNMNNMWGMVYGPGKNDCTWRHAREFFLCDPREVPRKVSPYRRKRLEAELSRAVSAMDFRRAEVLKRILFGEQPQYRIWSERKDAWYAPESCGYRSDKVDAGLYTEDEARRLIAGHSFLKMIPVFPNFQPAQVAAE
ncbi:hypothetical protein ABNQ39_00335 (plasmid) [Azospirillum sp. A26]|uniref:hypothetical protein n=1 Tax=Azospirillum sp. A26 TaxID=3160607 RepID=UPI0036719E0F